LKKLEEKEGHVREYLYDTLNPEEIEAAVRPLQMKRTLSISN